MKNKKIYTNVCLVILLPMLFGVILFKILPTDTKTAYACACGSPSFDCYPEGGGGGADDPDSQNNLTTSSIDYNNPDYAPEKADIASSTNYDSKNHSMKYEIISFFQNALSNATNFLHKLL